MSAFKDNETRLRGDSIAPGIDPEPKLAMSRRRIRRGDPKAIPHLKRVGKVSRSGLKRAFALGLGLVIPLSMALGCASKPTASRTTRDISAQGPGTVFFSIEAAAYDALSYSYLFSRSARKPSHALGGTIYSIAGGFTYTAPVRAKKFNPDEVSYPLRAKDVAHYHTYPKHWDRRVNVAREKFSTADRLVVDVVDPLHRPSFVLTPRLRVKVYRGESDGTLFLAKLGDWNDVMRLAASAPGPSGDRSDFSARTFAVPAQAHGALSEFDLEPGEEPESSW